MRKGPLVVYNEDNGIVPGMWNLPGVETCQLKDTVPQYFRNALLFLGYTDPTDLNTIPPVDRLTLAVDLGVATLVGEGGSELRKRPDYRMSIPTGLLIQMTILVESDGRKVILVGAESPTSITVIELYTIIKLLSIIGRIKTIQTTSSPETQSQSSHESQP
eukprot:350618_1